MSMWDLIIKKGFPPTRNIRYCCSDLKEHGGEGCFVITGVRWAESKKRQAREMVEILGNKKSAIQLNNDNNEKRRMIENCSIKGKRILNPIIDWSDEDVWNFIYRYIHTYCNLYDCGFSRLGCIGCPLISIRKRKWELERYPKYKKAYIRTFTRMLQSRSLSVERTENTKWQTAEDVYDWWLYGNRKSEEVIKGQISLPILQKGSEMMNQIVESKQVAENNQEGKIKSFQKLREQWDTIYKNGKPDAMWTDGVTLNYIREEMVKISNEYPMNISKDDIPDEINPEYMAKAEEIRMQAKSEVTLYQENSNYQFLLSRLSQLSRSEKRKTEILTVLGRVHNLMQSVERDDLVVMREYGSDTQFLELLKETADKVKILPVRKERVVSNKSKKTTGKEIKAPGEEKENWEVKGQMSIFDIAS